MRKSVVQWRRKGGRETWLRAGIRREAPLSGGDLSPGDGRGARTDTGGADGRLAAYGVQAGARPVRRHGGAAALGGLDIDSWKEGREYRYRLVSREFELPELKLLVDAVQASRFITESKSLQSHQKAGVAGQRPRRPAAAAAGTHRRAGQDHEREYLLQHRQAPQRHRRGKQIRFSTFSGRWRRREALRRDGGWYCVSPWHLRWDDENYYLIAYDAEADRVKNYRVTR